MRALPERCCSVICPDSADALLVLPNCTLFSRGGFFSFDAEAGRPTCLLRLQTGPHPICCVQGSSWQNQEDFLKFGPDIGTIPVAHPRRAICTLYSWLHQRVGLMKCVQGAAELPDVVKTSFNIGGWLGLSLRHTALTSPGPSYQLQSGFHGSVMSSVFRIILRGLNTGFAHLDTTHGTYVGIFFHWAVRAQLCNSYMLYTPFGDGYFVAPLFELQVIHPDPAGRSMHIKRKRGTHQQLTHEDNCVVTAVHFLFLHWSEIAVAPKSSWFWMESRFKAYHELDPAEEWEEIQERSRDRGVQVVFPET